MFECACWLTLNYACIFLYGSLENAGLFTRLFQPEAQNWTENRMMEVKSATFVANRRCFVSWAGNEASTPAHIIQRLPHTSYRSRLGIGHCLGMKTGSRKADVHNGHSRGVVVKSTIYSTFIHKTATHHLAKVTKQEILVDHPSFMLPMWTSCWIGPLQSLLLSSSQPGSCQNIDTKLQ